MRRAVIGSLEAVSRCELEVRSTVGSPELSSRRPAGSPKAGTAERAQESGWTRGKHRRVVGPKAEHGVTRAEDGLEAMQAAWRQEQWRQEVEDAVRRPGMKKGVYTIMPTGTHSARPVSPTMAQEFGPSGRKVGPSPTRHYFLQRPSLSPRPNFFVL